MASSGMLRRVALVITDVSEELSTSSIRVTRIGNIPEDAILHSHRREKLKSYTVLLKFNFMTLRGGVACNFEFQWKSKFKEVH
jgi:hypothetical protein